MAVYEKLPNGGIVKGIWHEMNRKIMDLHSLALGGRDPGVHDPHLCSKRYHSIVCLNSLLPFHYKLLLPSPTPKRVLLFSYYSAVEDHRNVGVDVFRVYFFGKRHLRQRL